MSERDPQSIVLSRPSILLVMAVSVGLLTLCYVLGVQVGKQSAALRQSSLRGSGEELEELPAPIQEQLKALESGELVKTPRIAIKPKTSPPEGPKADSPPPEKLDTPGPGPSGQSTTRTDATKWTLQLVSTSDPAEAQRIASKAKAAGFTTTTVKDQGNYKVRLTKPGSRAEIDALEQKLKAKGFRTYPIRVS